MALHEFPVDDQGHPVGSEEDVLSARWAAMHKAAEALAKMLGKDLPSIERSITLYPVGNARDDTVRLDLETGDLCAVMQIGVSAILRAREHGAEAKVAARTLLARFERERRILLASDQHSEEELAA